MHIIEMNFNSTSNGLSRLGVVLAHENEIITMEIYNIEDQIRFKKFYASEGFFVDKDSDFYNDMTKYIIKTEKIIPQIYWPSPGVSGVLFPEGIQFIQDEIVKNLGIPEKILKPKEKLKRKVIL